jgi:hypothetical protein
MISLTLIAFLLVLGFAIYDAQAATIKQTMDGAMDVSLTFPDSVMAGRSFEVSILVQNNGWEDKQSITFTIPGQDGIIETKNDTLIIERLSKGGSYGATMTFSTAPNIPTGIHYLNVRYSQILLANNETPSAPAIKNIAVPINIKSEPQIQLNTVAPSAIFSNAEFSFDVEIISIDIDLRNVLVQITPPNDIALRGQSTHTFSSIQKGVPLTIHSQFITSPDEVTFEHKIPFIVTVTYLDDLGQEKTTSQTTSLLLRPRTFMELTTDGGVWIGGFFLAPYVSIGTLVGIPAGTIFSILIHRMVKKKDTKKRSTR